MTPWTQGVILLFTFGVSIHFVAANSHDPGFTVTTDDHPSTNNGDIVIDRLNLKRPSPFQRAIVTVTLVTIFLFSLLGNGFLIHRFAKRKRFRTPTNRLIISQCGADLVLTLLAMPLATVAQFTESGHLLPYPFDLIHIFSMRLFMTVSVLNLSVMAVDRLCSLSEHDVTSTLSPRKASVVAGLCWLLSIFVSLPMEIIAEGVEHYRHTVNTYFGLLRHHETTGEMIITAPALRTIILGLASVIVAIYCFVKLVYLINSRKAEAIPSALCESGQLRSVRLRLRSAYTVIAVFLVFFFSTLPFYTIFILTIANVPISPCLIMAAKLISWSSTATKPFIYIRRCKKWQARRLINRLNKKLTLNDFLKEKPVPFDEIKFFSQPAVDFTGSNIMRSSSDIVKAVDEEN